MLSNDSLHSTATSIAVRRATYYHSPLKQHYVGALGELAFHRLLCDQKIQHVPLFFDVTGQGIGDISMEHYLVEIKTRSVFSKQPIVINPYQYFGYLKQKKEIRFVFMATDYVHTFINGWCSIYDMIKTEKGYTPKHILSFHPKTWTNKDLPK